MQYQGSCHCGKIAFTVEGSLTQVAACNCSICSRRGYLLWFVPGKDLKLKTPKENLATYTFNSHTIKHHFCPSCGCAPFATSVDQQGAEGAAINVHCLDGVDPAKLEIYAVDGRSH